MGAGEVARSFEKVGDPCCTQTNVFYLGPVSCELFQCTSFSVASSRPVVPNQGAIYNTQGCRELMRFLIYY